MHVATTGASSGIGRALAQEYLSKGAKVTMVARRLEHMRETAGPNSDRVNFVVADLSNTEDAHHWIDDAEALFGPIDILINNAGTSVVHPTIDTDWAAVQNLMRLNVFTPFKLTCTLAPRMVARRSGCIVDIASAAALAPQPGFFFYNASKAALSAASESLRAELRPYGVHVLTVYPGPIHTPMAEANFSVFDPSLARWTPTGDPKVLAKLIANSVEQRKARVIYPRVYTLARWFPALFRWGVDRFTPPMKRPRTSVNTSPKLSAQFEDHVDSHS